jgi:putative membrane protein
MGVGPVGPREGVWEVAGPTRQHRPAPLARHFSRLYSQPFPGVAAVWPRIVKVLQDIWPPLPVWKRLDVCVLVVALYTLGVELLVDFVLKFQSPGWIGGLSVVNAVLLGVLLGFRNREAYERWWEARKLWGQLINDSRNLCVKVAALVNPPDGERAAFARLVVAFAVALKQHLRGGQPLQAVAGFHDDPATPAHVPAHLAGRVYQQLKEWKAAGKLTDIEFLALDPHARALLDVCGACERIRSSPVPLSYRSLLRHGTVLYLITAPWFMAAEYGYWAIAVVSLMAYFLLGTELTAENVEEPFGGDSDDLTLTTYCDVIRKSCTEVLGVELPPVVADAGFQTVSLPLQAVLNAVPRKS